MSARVYDKSGPYIQTYSGELVYFLDPDPDTIQIHDIAHALARLCRYVGHTSAFYSVAQHSVLAAREAADRGLGVEVIQAALMHDAAEAYVGDVSSPLKSILSEYVDIERRVWGAIARRFRLPGAIPDAVHRIDKAMLMAEAPKLLGAPRGPGWPHGVSPARVPIEPWPVERAEDEFRIAAGMWGIY